MRTKGAKDLKKRKTRSDKKYVYRKRHGNFIPYYPKQDKNDNVKIWFWKLELMSKDGIKRFPKHLQTSIKKTIFKKSIRVDVSPLRLSTKKEIEELSKEVLGEPGIFYIMMFCHRKNKWGVSPVKVCSIRISEVNGELKSKFIENFKLFRYWFWGEKRK